MSDVSQGPGWWLASDGKWYSPEQAPGTPGYGSATSTTGDEPVQVYLTSNEPLARWRALAHIFMAVPHFIIVVVLSYLAGILQLVSFFTVLFGAKVPGGIRDIQMMILRYNNRFWSFVALLTKQYPPFDFTATPADPGGHPLVTSFTPLERLARWRCLQPILLIPHIIVLFFVGIGAMFAYVAGWFAVLITGRMPDGISNFLVGVTRWSTRVNAYNYFLSDQYPPFSLD